MKRPRRPQKTVFTTIFGTTIVYTPRHINGCNLRDRNENHCSCPKWIYMKKRGGKAIQRAVRSPSFTEACAEAQRILRSFDPEIAKAREKNEPAPGISIEDALSLYEAALKRRSLSEKYASGCLLPFLRRNPKEYRNRKEHGRARNLSFLDWLDRENLTAREPVTRMEQITSDHLDQWSAAWQTNDSSSHTWRGLVNAFLTWARKHDHIKHQPEFRERQRVKPGNRCGHFTDDQIARLYASVPFYPMKGRAMPENFAPRLTAFIDLGRWAGMAIADIVNFQPRANLASNNVLTYRRVKSGGIASVLLTPEVAARLRRIPTEDGSDPDRPFRFNATDLETNRQTWRYRFQKLCEFVGITEVETETGVKPPHPHQLRDTFAIDAITRGVSLENVARMLGHASVTMTQKSYLFWVKKRDDHSIEDQRKALGKVKAAPEAEFEPLDEPPAVLQ